MQRLEEGDERGDLRRAEALAVRRHVPAALHHLPDQLILCEADGDVVERWPTLPTLVTERVAIAALLQLEHDRPLPLERASPLEVSRWNGLAAPGVHHRAPRRVGAEVREAAERHRDEHDREDGDGPPPPALLAFPG